MEAATLPLATRKIRSESQSFILKVAHPEFISPVRSGASVRYRRYWLNFSFCGSKSFARSTVGETDTAVMNTPLSLSTGATSCEVEAEISYSWVPRWIVGSIDRCSTTNCGQSWLGSDGFPVDFAKRTRQHIRHDILFAWDMSNSEIVIRKFDCPSREDIRSVRHFNETVFAFREKRLL